MQIHHPINSFLYSIFEVNEGELNELIATIKTFYTVDNLVPVIDSTDEVVTVFLNLSEPVVDQNIYKKLITLCELGKFREAYPIALELCQKNGSNSELFRIKGQIESELGEPEKAIDSLIDSLRWNPENVYALIMMGNIFARDKSDIETAMIYYKQASIIDPEDHMSLNNIGANLLSLERYDEAQKYFEKANIISSDYPNTQYALGLLAFKKSNYNDAFNYAVKSIKLNSSRDALYLNSVTLIEDISAEISESDTTIRTLKEFIKHINEIAGVNTRIEVDNEIPTIAKVEYAENHNRDYHLIKYKEGYKGHLHLILHELVHIELASEAKITNDNLLFTSSEEHRKKFIADHGNYFKTLTKKGFSEESIRGVINNLFEGINRQVFNTPIDLFIEDRIFNKFPDFRPIQFTSLLTIVLEGLDAVTRKDVVEIMDVDILSKSKIYNLINAMHFRNLFEVDFIKNFKATHLEIKQAEKCYIEFLEYRDDKQAGEEYELVQHWGEDLKLNQYFKLVNEVQFRKSEPSYADLDFEYHIDIDTESNQKIEMHTFLEEHKDKDLNLSVMMYMIGALEYFKDKSDSQIKETAFQIASMGVNGIFPEKKSGYKVPSIKNSDFSGYQMLAYYYVSWALSAPQMLPDLNLPFEKEYKTATAFIKT